MNFLPPIFFFIYIIYRVKNRQKLHHFVVKKLFKKISKKVLTNRFWFVIIFRHSREARANEH